MQRFYFSFLWFYDSWFWTPWYLCVYPCSWWIWNVTVNCFSLRVSRTHFIFILWTWCLCSSNFKHWTQLILRYLNVMGIIDFTYFLDSNIVDNYSWRITVSIWEPPWKWWWLDGASSNWPTEIFSLNIRLYSYNIICCTLIWIPYPTRIEPLRCITLSFEQLILLS